MRYASRVAGLAGAEAAAWDIHHHAVERRARGEDVILLSVGDPDLPTPAPIVERAKASLDAGRTHYADVTGQAELRGAIAASHRRRSGQAVDPAQVVVLAGAQSALFAATAVPFGRERWGVLFRAAAYEAAPEGLLQRIEAVLGLGQAGALRYVDKRRGQHREAEQQAEQVGQRHPLVRGMRRQARQARAAGEAADREAPQRDGERAAQRDLQRVMVQRRDAEQRQREEQELDRNAQRSHRRQLSRGSARKPRPDRAR